MGHERSYIASGKTAVPFAPKKASQATSNLIFVLIELPDRSRELWLVVALRNFCHFITHGLAVSRLILDVSPLPYLMVRVPRICGQTDLTSRDMKDAGAPGLNGSGRGCFLRRPFQPVYPLAATAQRLMLSAELTVRD